MTAFENLRNSYFFALQYGMTNNATHEEAKKGNAILHKFCEKLVENSTYNDYQKQQMKFELELLNEALSQ